MLIKTGYPNLLTVVTSCFNFMNYWWVREVFFLQVCVLYLDVAEHWHCVFCVFQVQHISTAALVWLWSRTDLQKSFLPIVMVFMAVTCYRPLLIEWVLIFFLLNKCYTLSSYVLVHSFFSFCLKRALWRYMFDIFEIHSEILHHVHVCTVITII